MSLRRARPCSDFAYYTRPQKLMPCQASANYLVVRLLQPANPFLGGRGCSSTQRTPVLKIMVDAIAIMNTILNAFPAVPYTRRRRPKYELTGEQQHFSPPSSDYMLNRHVGMRRKRFRSRISVILRVKFESIRRNCTSKIKSQIKNLAL